ncbi:hypothetical protein I3V78_29325 [Archangium primigenium]|nr:hypothetical protein [Archangium primigenium]MBM7117652.1 hypothetical protein [Archangium primigenium]
MEPSSEGNTSAEGERRIASSRKGTSSVAMGMTSAWPPLVVSRCHDRPTVSNRLGTSTSVFRMASSSPLRSPV